MWQRFVLVLVIVFIGCNKVSKSEEVQLLDNSDQIAVLEIPKLDLSQANKLAQLPLRCIDTEYPNKLSQTLGGDEDLKSPSVLHPAFYGCFDWHSAVHGHWSLVSLLKINPDIENSKSLENKLLASLSKVNIEGELAYFSGKHNGSFERTYGWAWLLKLAEELHTWDHKTARVLEENLQPLTDVIVEKYTAYLPKLNYPTRVGTHSNTAFGMSFAYDYALAVNNTKFQSAIESRAKYFFLNDENCPMSWEPGGSDFLSPCLEEAALMKRLLPKDEFVPWLAAFLPELKNKNFSLDTGKVSDRNDGHLVHLDGLNFSRAWSLNTISEGLPEYSHLKPIAVQHLNHSLPSIFGDTYEGGHWLGSFAIYALNSF